MQAKYNENLVKNLPDAYKKTTGSNNFKILEVERRTLEEVRESLRWIDSILDIHNAKGKTLDLYGERAGQPRGVADDEKYILMIKAKLQRNIASGSYPSVVNALCNTFQCEPSQVLIVDGEDPYTVTLAALPLDVINKAGLTTSQTVAIVKSMLPVGISLTSFLFDGTFELATSYEDMKVDGDTKGLTDTYENIKNADAIGGYLGVSVGDEREALLPI